MKKLMMMLGVMIFLLVFTVGCQSNKQYTINQTTIHATLFPDGSMKVEELDSYTFNGVFHGTTRTINNADVTQFKAYLVKDLNDPFNIKKATPLATKKQTILIGGGAGAF